MIKELFIAIVALFFALTFIQSSSFPKLIVRVVLIASSIFGSFEIEKLMKKVIFGDDNSPAEYNYDTIWYIIGLLFASGILIQIMKKVVNYEESVISSDIIYPIILAVLYLPIFINLKYYKSQLGSNLLVAWGFSSSMVMIQLQVIGMENNILNIFMVYILVELVILSLIYSAENTVKVIDYMERFLTL
jgi:hypothetical protein